MEFAPAIKVSGPAELVSQYSFDGKYLAFVDTMVDDLERRRKGRKQGAGGQSVIRLLDATSLDEVCVLKTQGQCTRLLWAPGAHLLLSVTKRPSSVGSAVSVSHPPQGELLELWDANTDFYLSLETGPGGASDHVQWAPDSRHVLVTSCFSMQTTIWSFENGGACFIEAPKPGSRAVFSHAGDRLAVLERRACKDYVCVIACPDADDGRWRLIVRFPTVTAEGQSTDVVEVAWSPNDSVLVTRDRALDYRLSSYDPHSGDELGTVLLGPLETQGLGARCMKFSPNDPLVAVGSFDGEIRLFGAGDHQPPHLGLLWTQNHPSVLPTDSFICYRERRAPAELGDEFLDRIPVRPTHYELAIAPGIVPSAVAAVLCRLATAPRPSPDDKDPRCGVRWLEFSPCGRYLASITDSQPHALFVWAIADAKSNGYVLEHLGPVVAAGWCPGRMGDDARLCCVQRDAPNLFLWTPRGAAAVAIPVMDDSDVDRAARLGLPHFRPRSLRWSPEGKSLLMFGSSSRLGPNAIVHVDVSDDL